MITKLPSGLHSTWGMGRTEPDPTASRTIDDGVIVPLGKPVDKDINTGLLYNEYPFIIIPNNILGFAWGEIDNTRAPRETFNLLTDSATQSTEWHEKKIFTVTKDFSTYIITFFITFVTAALSR